MERMKFKERLRSRRPYILTLMATLALSANLHLSQDVEAKHSHPEKAPVAAAPAFEPIDDFGDLELYFLEDPSVDLPLRHTSNKIHEIFTRAGENITQSTDGTYSLPGKIPMYTVQKAPSGEERLNGEICYTTGEIFELGKSLRKHERQDIGIIVNETAACGEDDAAAWAYSNENITAYPVVDERIVAHELGHTRKLGHRAVIGCYDYEHGGFDVSRPLSAMMDDPACHAVKNEKGEVDQYHSWHSVMGRGAAPYQEVYHPLELQKLDPAKFRITEVEPVEQRVSLDVLNAGTRGITFRLPEAHSLHKADPKMETVSITAMRRDDYEGESPEAEIVVTAASKDMQYDLVVQGIASIDLHRTRFGIGFDIEEVYVDAELGIRVTATQDLEDTGNVLLHVSRLEK